MDIRLKQLSYSSRLLLHACPKKYQLYRLNSKVEIPEDAESSVTFAFGHCVGLGIQEILTHGSLDTAIFAMFKMWEPDLFASNVRQVKSFWHAVSAVRSFHSLGLLSGWSLATFNGKPATELSFIINFPDGFTYKGFVDAVLVNNETGEVMVLEVKTTSSTSVAAATYKNSAQAIGYSIVLDSIFPGISSYKVRYLVYKTKSKEFEILDFAKNYLQRALWISELLLDIEFIKMCEESQVYPMHGESCYNFYRECEYMNICTLSLDALTESITIEGEEKILEANKSDFQISLNIEDLIQAQLEKE